MKLRLIALFLLVVLVSQMAAATWTDAGCNKKRAIEFQSPANDINTNSYIFISDLNIQSWNAGNVNNIKVGNEITGAEVPSEVAVPDTNNVSVFFKLPAIIRAGTDANSLYALYYDCNSARTGISNLQAWYPFEDGNGVRAVDYATGQDYNLTISNLTETSPAWTTNSAFGKYALDVNANYWAKNVTLLDTPVSTIVSISFWFKLRNTFNTSSAWSYPLITKRDGVLLNILLNKATGKLTVSSQYGGGLDSIATSWGPNVWHNVAWDCNGSTIERLYIDGQLNDSGNISDPVVCLEASTGFPFNIGTNQALDLNADAIFDNVVVIKTEDTNFYSISDKPIAMVGTEQKYGVTADYNYSPSNPFLFASPSQTTATVTFTDKTSVTSGFTLITWKWKQNGISFSTDQNTSKVYSIIGDYNICLTTIAKNVVDVNYEDTMCKTLQVNQYAQGLSFTWIPHESNLNAWNYDFNGTATNSADVNAWIWDFNDGTHYSGQDLNHTFSAAGDYNVCLTATIDANKTVCNIATASTLTIKVPIDEKSGGTITPFETRVEGTIQVQDKNNLYANTIFYISTTEEFNLVIGDTNGLYYSRHYKVSTVPGTYAYTLQPYLAPVSEGVLTTAYTRGNLVTNVVEPNIRIATWKAISGIGLVKVEEVITDIKGEALMSFIANHNYTLKIYKEGVEILDVNYTSTSTSFYVYIDDQTANWDKNYGMVYVRFIPPGDILHDTNLSVIQKIYASKAMSSIRIVAENNDVNVYDQTFTGASIVAGLANIITLGSLGINKDYMVNVHVYVVTSDGKHYEAATFYFFPRGHTDYVEMLRTGMRTDFGCSADASSDCPPLFLSALFIIAICCGAVIRSVGMRIDAIAILALGVASLFAYLWWIPTFYFVVMCFATFAMIMFQWRSN